MTETQTRRQFVGTISGTTLLAGGWGDWLDGFFGDDTDDPTIDVYAETKENVDDVDIEEDRIVLALDTGSIFRPDVENDEWVMIETTGKNPVFDSAVISELRTLNIGVSANQSTDLAVGSGSANETRIAIDDTTHPHFDSFDELDEDNNKIVIKHPSHHVLSAHALLESASGPGQVMLRVYVNGIERIFSEGSAKNGLDMTASAAKNLKLEVGDENWATVEHDTGGTETFPGDRDGNSVAVVRQ